MVTAAAERGLKRVVVCAEEEEKEVEVEVVVVAVVVVLLEVVEAIEGLMIVAVDG